MRGSQLWPAAGITGVLIASLCTAVVAAQPATAAEPAPCRVRNVTQDTSGGSLIQMVEQAVDGDSLEVLGTCPGKVVMDVDIAISGLGDQPTLTGRHRTTVVRVKRGVTVTIRDMTIQDGRGGIRTEGTLMLEDVLVRRQSRRGIVNGGRMTIIGSTIRRNSGGGIFNFGTLHITSSAVKRNASVGYGGGILNHYGAELRLTDSTISGNRARFRGGGVYNGDPASSTGGETVTLIGTSVSGNVAGDRGGGIASNWPGNVTLDADSSVTGNTPNDCFPASVC